VLFFTGEFVGAKMRKWLFAAAAAASFIGFIGPATAYTDQEISTALMANAWCSFSYNQTTGYSHSKRAVFGGNGILSINSGNEGGSSGYGGSYYGQSSGGESYGWAVKGGVLYLSDGATWDAHSLDAKNNSNGSLILIVDGKEWSTCG
jgi:hypothetical protein